MVLLWLLLMLQMLLMLLLMRVRMRVIVRVAVRMCVRLWVWLDIPWRRLRARLHSQVHEFRCMFRVVLPYVVRRNGKERKGLFVLMEAAATATLRNTHTHQPQTNRIERVRREILRHNHSTVALHWYMRPPF